MLDKFCAFRRKDDLAFTIDDPSPKVSLGKGYNLLLAVAQFGILDIVAIDHLGRFWDRDGSRPLNDRSRDVGGNTGIVVIRDSTAGLTLHGGFTTSRRWLG